MGQLYWYTWYIMMLCQGSGFGAEVELRDPTQGTYYSCSAKLVLVVLQCVLQDVPTIQSTL